MGLDIAKKEVEHAMRRAEARNEANLTFVHGDMERMPLPDGHVDCVISNGAFCLAPSKEKAFAEVLPRLQVSFICNRMQYINQIAPTVNVLKPSPVGAPKL